MNVEIIEFAYNYMEELLEQGHEITDVTINSDRISIGYITRYGTKLEVKLNPKNLGLI